MRVHYFHSGNVQAPAANAVQVMRMCGAFAQNSAAVELFYPQYAWGNPLAAEECRAYYGVEPSFRLRPLPGFFTSGLMTMPGYLPAAKLLAYAIEAVRGCDIMYTRCATAAATLPFLRRLGPTPRPIVAFEAHEFPRDGARARTLRHVDAIVAITRVIADELQHVLGYPASRILVAPDGVPDAWLEPIAKADARQRLGMHTQHPLVTFTGKLHPDTLPLLFDAAERLRDRADMLIVGAPPGAPDGVDRALEDLRQRAQPRGLAMQFVGPVRAGDVRLYQSAADVLIAPYSGALRWARYTSPLKIFEYMAAGRPMVVSDLPVLHEVIEHDTGAWLVPAADGTAIGMAVAMLLDRPEIGERLARRARADAARYTWNTRAARILDFLARMERPR